MFFTTSISTLPFVTFKYYSRTVAEYVDVESLAYNNIMWWHFCTYKPIGLIQLILLGFNGNVQSWFLLVLNFHHQRFCDRSECEILTTYAGALLFRLTCKPTITAKAVLGDKTFPFRTISLELCSAKRQRSNKQIFHGIKEWVFKLYCSQIIMMTRSFGSPFSSPSRLSYVL